MAKIEMLTTAEYYAAERAALTTLSNRQIQAFKPHGFNTVGFPSEISSNSEIVRFVDALHEHNHQSYVSPSFLYSRSEKESFTRIIEAVGAATLERFGKALRPSTSVLTSIELFRILERLQAAHGDRLSILEIGPGSGYLGAAIIDSGSRYLAMENASGFYLWQSMLMQTLTSDFSELARNQIAGTSRAIHIPWWEWAVKDSMSRLAPVDILISDAVISEMHPMARAFLWRIFRQLSDPSATPMVIVGRPGQPLFGDASTISQEVADCGYRCIAAGDINVFSPNEKADRAQDLLRDTQLNLADRSAVQPVDRAEYTSESILGHFRPSPDLEFWSYVNSRR